MLSASLPRFAVAIQMPNSRKNPIGGHPSRSDDTVLIVIVLCSFVEHGLPFLGLDDEWSD